MVVQMNCPRCGYDQRGVVAGWQRRCPLHGTCAECGLEFEWAEILSPTRKPPSWCVEHASGPVKLVGRGVKTLLRTFRPWQFWRDLRMSHEIKWRRLIGYTIALTGALYILLCVCHGAMAVSMARQVATWGVPVGGRWAGPPNAADEFLHAALLPFSGQSIAGRGSSPRELFVYTWLPALGAAALLLLLHALSAAGFAVLPISRRRANVRWAHIFRITVYGLGLLVPLVVLVLCGTCLAVQWRSPISPLGALVLRAAVVYACALVPFELAWWSLATGRYLRMQHAWAVGASVVIMALLSTTIVGLFIGSAV